MVEDKRPPRNASALIGRDRPLPHARESEQHILGVALMDEQQAHSIRAKLKANAMFYSPSHGAIFDAIVSLLDQEKAPDQLLVASELEKQGKLKEAGGRAYLAEIAGEYGWLSSQIDHHLDLVTQAFMRRKTIGLCADALGRSFDTTEEISDILTDVEEELRGVYAHFDSEGVRPIGEYVAGALDNIEATRHSDEESAGLSTGSDSVDSYFRLRPGEMIVVAARPSIGKSALAMNWQTLLSVLFSHPTLLFSIEMDGEKLAERVLNNLTDSQLGKWGAGDFDSETGGKVANAVDRLKKAELYIDESADIGVVDIRARARQYVREAGVELVAVDYLQIIREKGRLRHRNRESVISMFSQQMKAMAKELKIPVVILAQLNRQAEGEVPRLSHLRESGSIEQDADVVVMLNRERGTGDNDTVFFDAELIIAKNRNGATDVIDARFYPKTQTWVFPDKYGAFLEDEDSYMNREF